LKTILNTGGQLIQGEIKKGIKLTYETEALLLIKSIRVNTISKLTYTDSRKYEFLQADMFPGIKSEDIAYEQLNTAITEAITDLKLQYIEKQVQKILQFYEATRQRMGVILVGPSGCGKTTIWKVLKLALEKMKKHRDSRHEPKINASSAAPGANESRHSGIPGWSAHSEC